MQHNIHAIKQHFFDYFKRPRRPPTIEINDDDNSKKRPITRLRSASVGALPYVPQFKELESPPPIIYSQKISIPKLTTASSSGDIKYNDIKGEDIKGEDIKTYMETIRDLTIKNIDIKIQKEKDNFTDYMTALVELLEEYIINYNNLGTKPINLQNFVFSYIIQFGEKKNQLDYCDDFAEKDCFAYIHRSPVDKRYNGFRISDIYKYFASHDTMTPSEFSNLRIKLIKCCKIHEKNIECDNMAIEVKFTVYETNNFFKIYNDKNDKYKPYIETLMQFVKTEFEKLYDEDIVMLKKYIYDSVSSSAFECKYNNHCPTQYFLYKIKQDPTFEGFKIVAQYPNGIIISWGIN